MLSAVKTPYSYDGSSPPAGNLNNLIHHPSPADWTFDALGPNSLICQKWVLPSAYVKIAIEAMALFWNRGIYPLISMVDLSSSFFVTVYQAGYIH